MNKFDGFNNQFYGGDITKSSLSVGKKTHDILSTSLHGACNACGSSPCEDWCGKKEY